MSKTRILITGGAGYIGSLLTPRLLSQNYEVTVIDNFMYNQNSLNNLCSNKNFNIINADIRDKNILRESSTNKDIIIPLAAYVGAPLCNKDPFGAKEVNLNAQLELLKSISKNQIVVMPMTNSGYGIGEKDSYCDENTPLRPISLYGKHKVEVEEVLLGRENSISLRLATVFGMSPRMRLDLLVNDFVNRACNDKAIIIFEGGFRRNFVHIRDVVEAFNFSIDNFEKMKGEAYNIGLSDANLTKLDLCKKIKEHIKDFFYYEAPIGEDPDKRDYIVSNKKIENLGFAARNSLDDGIEELIKGNKMLKFKNFTNI